MELYSLKQKGIVGVTMPLLFRSSNLLCGSLTPDAVDGKNEHHSRRDPRSGDN
jgi:hypothetical protein